MTKQLLVSIAIQDQLQLSAHFFFLTVNQDYLAKNSTVAVRGNSNLTYQFSIELLADDVVEGNETFSLHLSSSDTRVMLNTPNTMITIVNEDRSKLSSTFSVLNHPKAGTLLYTFYIAFIHAGWT